MLWYYISNMNKLKLNIHCRGSPWGNRTQQHTYCLRYAHSHHIESHLGKKQPQAKIAIAFLFSQLHFNNVTSHALFLRRPSCYAQKEMRSAKPGNHLKLLCIYIILKGVFQWGNSRLLLQSRSVLGSFDVVLMSCKVNFLLVRSALQCSACRI